jgi:hypothetical protein
MPLERLTMLVVTHDSVAALVVPRLEAPRVTPFDDVFKAACDYWFKRLDRYKLAKIKEDKYFNKHGSLPKGFK